MAITLSVWEFDRATDLDWATRAVLDGLVKPAFQVAFLSSQGDAITVQLVGAKGPRGDPDAVYYLEKRGTYVLERVEEWPPVPGKTKKPLSPKEIAARCRYQLRRNEEARFGHWLARRLNPPSWRRGRDLVQ